MFDIESFYIDQKIYIGPKNHKHSRAGWVNIACPFCSGNPGFHMGFNKKQSYFRCYRCGWHPFNQVIEAITGIKDEDKQKSILSKYYTKDKEEDIQIFKGADRIEYPIGTSPMSRKHKLYLIDRMFDANKLEKEWNLLGTNHIDPDYKFRILAPIEFEFNLVSFQCRDITNYQSERYKACSKESEVIHHKHVLYGWDKARFDSCLVVEGITGAWRFGPGALATFGAQYKPSQIRLIASRYKRSFLLQDDDEAGQIASDSMSVELSVLGVETIILELEKGDSGEVPQDIADQFMRKEILKK